MAEVAYERVEIAAAEVPQANRLERVIALVAEGPGVSATTPGTAAHRDGLYYRSAAHLLGWVDASGSRTDAGERLARGEGGWSGKLAAAKASVARLRVTQAWCAWARVADIVALDPNSAEDFLLECCDLAEAAALRRAACLRNWWHTVCDATAADKTDAELDTWLAGPLVEPGFSMRLLNWAARNQVETVSQLVRWSPHELLAQRNLGRTTLQQARTAMSERTGRTWEELHRHVMNGASENAPRSQEVKALSRTADTRLGSLDGVRWDVMNGCLPEAVRQTPLDHLELPARMRNWAAAHHVCTVQELLAHSLTALHAERNLGRRTLGTTLDVIRDHARVCASSGARQEGDARAQASDPNEVALPSVGSYPNFHALWRAQVATLSAQERMILSRRAGASGMRVTLAELGELLGISRERVRQLEQQAVRRLVRRDWWVRGLRARLVEALSDGAVRVADLHADRWFAGSEGWEAELGFVLNRVLEGELYLVRLDEESWVSIEAQSRWDEAAREARAILRQWPLPAPLAVIREALFQQLRTESVGTVRAIWGSLEQNLHVVEQYGQPHVMGFGNTRGAQVLAFLNGSQAPVGVAEIERRFGRGVLPAEAIYVARGTVWLAAKIPGFELWRARLATACVRIMREDAAERQWSAAELLEELVELGPLPEWVTQWVLGSMLRLSSEVRYLGRLRVSLPDAGPSSRRYLHDVAREILSAHAAPMAEEELRELLAKQVAFTDLGFGSLVAGIRGGVARVAPGVMGLVERDIPGGAEAFAEAADVLIEALAGRGEGLALPDALGTLQEQEQRFAGWNKEMCLACARCHGELRTARSGAIGLAAWESVRVADRRELLEQSLEEGDGRASVEDVLATFEAVHGGSPSSNGLAGLAAAVGARLRNGMIVRAELLEADVLAEAADPVPELLASGVLDVLPVETRPFFDSLFREAMGSFQAMKHEMAAYVARFERESQTNEFLSLQEARDLEVLCGRLLDEYAEADEQRQRLAWAAARYFVLEEDGDSDFGIGGLDDDVHAANAVAKYLGHPEWCIELC